MLSELSAFQQLMLYIDRLTTLNFQLYNRIANIDVFLDILYARASNTSVQVFAKLSIKYVYNYNDFLIIFEN